MKDNTMTIRVSKLPITIGTLHRVETPTDAIRLISNYDQLQRYVAEFGDVEVVKDDDGWKSTFRVPEFKEQIERYNAAKAIDCARNGCE
jgi:hypothetical protein